jgi:hypothetical protein
MTPPTTPLCVRLRPMVRTDAAIAGERLAPGTVEQFR